MVHHCEIEHDHKWKYILVSFRSTAFQSNFVHILQRHYCSEQYLSMPTAAIIYISLPHWVYDLSATTTASHFNLLYLLYMIYISSYHCHPLQPAILSVYKQIKRGTSIFMPPFHTERPNEVKLSIMLCQ